MERRIARALMGRLTRDADRICAQFGLRYAALQPERANVKRRYGICYSDGTVKIRLQHAATGKPLKYSSLVNTLCHELAHLRHFNHGAGFQDLYGRLLAWARREGIYRPGPPATTRAERRSEHATLAAKAPPSTTPPPVDSPQGRPAAPVQLTLF